MFNCVKFDLDDPKLQQSISINLDLSIHHCMRTLPYIICNSKVMTKVKVVDMQRERQTQLISSGHKNKGNNIQ